MKNKSASKIVILGGILLAAVIMSVMQRQEITKKSETIVGHLQTKTCEKGMGPQFKTERVEEIKNLVMTAIKNRDEKGLLSLASCDFLIGPPDSDSGGFNRPQNVIPLFLAVVKDLNWKENVYQDKYIYLVSSDGAEHEHNLIFKPDNDGKWSFDGYSTTDESILSQMYVGEDIEEEEAESPGDPEAVDQ